MKIFGYLIIVLISFLAFISCQKDFSSETGGTSGGGTGSNNAWSFNHGSAFSHGSFDTALFVPNPVGAGWLFFVTGRTSANADTALTFFSLLPSATLAPGSYSTNQSQTLFSVNNADSTNGDPIYTSNDDTPDAVMTIVIVSYDAATKLVTGTFSGNAIKEIDGGLVSVTNGKFYAVLQ